VARCGSCLDAARQFANDYNNHWLLERHGYRTPRQARDALRQPAVA
jgi:hypothetical protein